MLSKTIYLIRGLPGSGKSTLAKSLGLSVYEADDYFYTEGGYKFDASKLYQAHKDCQRKVRISLAAGNSCVVSNTFTTEKELKPYLDMARDYGFRVVSLIVENRHGNASVHDVSEETLNKMEKRFSVKLRT